MSHNRSDNKRGGSAESRSGAVGKNKVHGNYSPCGPGMAPGVGQRGKNAARSADEKEVNAAEAKSDNHQAADLEQQHKEAMTERD